MYLPLSCSISKIGLSRFVYVLGDIFSAVTTCRGFHLTDRQAEKLALLHLRLFPRPFSSHATECSGIVGVGTSVCRFKSVPTSVIADRLFSMFSGVFCLRLKPYLVVKIASHVLTEHYCQACVLAMMICRPDCRLCTGMCAKWLHNQETPCTSVPRVLTLRQANMGYGKYSLHLSILIFTFYLNRETHRCLNYSLSFYSIKMILRVDSSRSARDTAAMLYHSRHRGESAKITVNFFVAHTVNFVISTNHTIIDWMPLNFTCSHQIFSRTVTNRAERLRNHFAQLTGWAVNLSCQNPKPANWEAILFLIS